MGMQQSRTRGTFLPSSHKPRPPPAACRTEPPPPPGPSRLATLPVDLLTLVFHHLPICDLQLVGETCRDLHAAVTHDATLWTHVELPLQDTRLEADTKEVFLSRLLRQRPTCVRTLSLLGARDVTGGCLLAFSPPPASSLALPVLGITTLRELDLSHCPGLQLSLLERALPAVCHSLRSLSLRNTDHLLNDAAVTSILTHLAVHDDDDPAATTTTNPTTALQFLHLGTSTRRGARPGPDLTDDGLALIGARCPELQNLSVHNQAALTDEGVAAFVVALARVAGGPNHLQALDLGLCSSLSDGGILALATYCRQLRRLSLRNCWRVTDQGVQAILGTNPQLEALNVYCCTFVSPDVFATRWPRPPAAAAAAAPFLPPTTTLPALREANLSYMRGLHDADLLNLSYLTAHGLREVSVAKCDQLTNEALVQLCNECHLEALNVADCLRIDASFVHLLAAAAAAAGSASPTTTLSTIKSASSLAAAAAAAGSGGRAPPPPPTTCRSSPLATLHSLNARHCRRWTDETTALLLSPLGCGARNLRRLYLGGTAAGGRDCGSELDGPNGEIIWAPPTPTAAGLPHHPPTFDMYEDDGEGGGMCEEAGWSGSRGRGPTDQSVLLLAKTLGRGLQILDLEGCEGVSDKGLVALFAGCYRLQRLVLSGLPLVTDEAVQELLPSKRGRHPRLPCLVDLHLNFCGEVSTHIAAELKRQRPDILRLSHRREVALRGPPAF